MGKLSKEQQQILVGVAVAFLFVFGYWNYILRPQMKKIQENRQKLSDLVARVDVVERQARRLPALQAEQEKLRIELVELEKQLPRDKDVPNIIRTLTKEAMAENLVFRSLSPKPLSRKDFFEIIPFDLQFTGNLQALGRFLSSIGQQDRIFQSQNIALTPAGAGDATSSITNLNISLTIVTYSYAG